jgi:hypothetical protein
MGVSFNTDYSSDYITVRTASDISGYNEQYLRRLLRQEVFDSKRLGQLWLIDRNNFIEYLRKAEQSNDHRFGPKNV